VNFPVLVVGAGSIGERHLRCFQQTGRATVSFCETRPQVREALALQYQAPAFASLDDALEAGRFDAAVICTPAHLHIPIAETALRADLATLIEKPLSTSLEGVDHLGHLRDEKGVAVGVAYVLRFVPALQQARELLQTGELGAPLHASVVTGQHFPTFRPAYRETYYTRHESGGGAIQDALTHSAHSMEWLLGPTTSLFCDASHQALEGVTVEDTVNVLARNGRTLVNYALNQFQAPNEKHIWIHCERGSLKIESHRSRWGTQRHGEKDWTWQEAPLGERDAMFIAQAHAFLDSLEGKPSDLASLEAGVQTLKFNLAALESARTGRKVNL
jgi:predicted dehydrogenase